MLVLKCLSMAMPLSGLHLSALMNVGCLVLMWLLHYSCRMVNGGVPHAVVMLVC